MNVIGSDKEKETASKARAYELLEMYLTEKEGAEIVYNEDAMFIYKIEASNLHISNAITDKSKRRSGKAKELLQYLNDVVAKQYQSRTITCNVDQNQFNPELSLKSVLGTGFNIIPTNHPAHDPRMPSNMIQFFKEVK